MKILFTALATILTLGSCASNGQKGSADEANDSTNAHVTFVKPLKAEVDVNSIKDATVPVSFSVKDFDWMGGNLTMTVYMENKYDSLEVQQLAKGDTIACDTSTIVVDSMKNDGNYVVINGGYENFGLNLRSCNNGTYRASIEDDHSVYTELGKAQLPLADDFTIIDCKDDPAAPSDTIKTDQKLYLENLVDYKQDFSNLNTRVQVKNGFITNITRFWIP